MPEKRQITMNPDLLINIDAVVVDLNCQAILGMDILGDASKLPFILDLVEDIIWWRL